MNNINYLFLLDNISDEIKNEYTKKVRPLNNNTIGYLLTVNNIDYMNNNASNLLQDALLEEIEVSEEIQEALVVAEKEGLFDK